MTALHIVVHGEPAPQGSKRHVGKGLMIESSKKVKPWRQDVVAAAIHAIVTRKGTSLAAIASADDEWRPLDGPIRCRMVFTLAKPASAPKRKRTYPCRKPDIDKLARSTLDAIVTAGVIVDDSRVIDLHVRKVFPSEDPEALQSSGAQIWVEVVE